MQKNVKLKEKRVDIGTYHIIVCTTHKNLEKLGWFFIVCSSQYANISINEELMSGPDLANQESLGT